MKSFFEEYGYVILAAIVVILLIAMATPIGDLIRIQIDNAINSFGSKTQTRLNATDGVINVRISTANNKITLEWDAVKKEDKFKYQYKASTTSKDANWTDVKDIDAGNDKSRKVEITTDSNNQPLTNKTKVEYKIYDSNDVLVASGITTAKISNTGNTENGDNNSGNTTVDLTTGQKITIAGKEYTVIEQVEGNKYKVLAPVSSTHKFDASSNNYATSEIATYLDGEYYNNLDASIKSAIFETSIQQKVSSTGYDNGKNSPTWTGETKNAGTHKVFIPSWDEMTIAAGGTDKATLKTFLNSKYVWLRDTYGSHVLVVDGNGYLYGGYPYSVSYGDCFVRPAFVLDLSKVEYTIK